ncbi:MAG: sialidase family protein [Streptosporangiaceae bacterium]
MSRLKILVTLFLGAAVVMAPGLAGIARAAPGGPVALSSHPGRFGSAALNWTRPRRWAKANDWEPNVAASPTSAWVYQMTTRYGHPSVCAKRMTNCLVFRASANHGRTWTVARPLPRRYCPPNRHHCVLARAQNDPVFQVSDTGVIYAAWMDDWDVVFMRSTDHGRTWHDVIDFRRRSGLSFTDKPWIAISPSGRDVYVAFNASNSYIAASHDFGRTWSVPVKTNTDGRYWFAEGGAVGRNGRVYFAESAEHQNAKGNIELTVISSVNRGRTWRTSIVGLSQQQPRCRVANCLNDFYGSQISLALGRYGTVLAAFTANQAAGAPLRLYTVRSADGRHWTRPRLLADQGTAVGADFPKVVAGLRPGVFVVAWEDDRFGAAAWNLWAVRTSNAGSTWSPQSRVSVPGPGQRAAGFTFPYGDYFGMSVAANGAIYLAWSQGASYDGPGSTWWSMTRR